MQVHISEFRIKTWKEINPPWLWHLVEILEMLLLYVIWMMHANLSLTFSPSAESHLKMLIYYMLKDDWPHHLSETRMSVKVFQFTFRLDMVKDDWPSLPGSDIWWKSWKFHFCMYSPMMHANVPQPFSHQLRAIWKY